MKAQRNQILERAWERNWIAQGLQTGNQENDGRNIFEYETTHRQSAKKSAFCLFRARRSLSELMSL